MTVPEGNPEDEIRHAQRMIDAKDEDEPEDKVIKLMNGFANWNFNVDTPDLENTSGNTLMHHACLVGVANRRSRALVYTYSVIVVNSLDHQKWP